MRRRGGVPAVIAVALLCGCGSPPPATTPSDATAATSASTMPPPDTVPVTATTVAAPATTTASTSAAPTTNAPTSAEPEVFTGTVEVPQGRLDAALDDLFAVHVDGDLWWHPGAIGTTPGVPVRVLDLGDPRIEPTEGPGPNTVDGVVGDVDGVVFVTDCCEPISGNLFAVVSPGAPPVRLGGGYSPSLSPDRARLATANSYALTVLDLASGTYQSRMLGGAGAFVDVWDLVWSRDGSSLIVLFFDDAGFGLQPFDARSPFEPGAARSLGIEFDPETSDVRLVGTGPHGEIAVSVREPWEVAIRYFGPATLTEITDMRRTLPASASALRLANDGVGLLWVDDTTLWYLPAGGDARELGAGYRAAWFAT